MKVRIVTEKELHQCVTLDMDAFKAVSRGYSLLSEGKATQPPIMRIDIHDRNGEVDVKTAYVHGLDHFAIKIASGFQDNRLKGLPTSCGIMIVYNAHTGYPEAFLLDNVYLTSVRTGIAGSIAAQYLAPASIHTAGVIGSGRQARYQIQGLHLVRNFQRLLIYGVIPEEIDRYIQDMSAELGIEVIQAASAEEVVRRSQFVVTTTPSHSPYLQADWLHPGLHITCMGSDAPHKQELFPEVFKKADLICCDSKDAVFRLGEIHHAMEAGILTPDSPITELGELTSGKKTGRQNDNEFTICDLVGVGVQDTSIALLAYQRVLERGLGIEIEN